MAVCLGCDLPRGGQDVGTRRGSGGGARVGGPTKSTRCMPRRLLLRVRGGGIKGDTAAEKELSGLKRDLVVAISVNTPPPGKAASIAEQLPRRAHHARQTQAAGERLNGFPWGVAVPRAYGAGWAWVRRPLGPSFGPRRGRQTHTWREARVHLTVRRGDTRVAVVATCGNQPVY